MSTGTQNIRPSTTPFGAALNHELIESAIAVNEASTLDEAFQVLAEKGLALLGCDRLAIVVGRDEWSPGGLRADVHSGARAAWRPQALPYAFRSPPRRESAPATPIWDEPLTEEDAETAAELLRAHAPHVDPRAFAPRGRAASARLGARRRRRRRPRLHAYDSEAECSRPRTARDPGRHGDRDGALQPSTPRRPDVRVPAGQVPGRETIATGTGGRFRIRASALDGRELVLDGTSPPPRTAPWWCFATSQPSTSAPC